MKLRLVVDDWEHSAKEEQVACLYRLDVSTKRRRGGWELDAKVEQPAVCTARLRIFWAYHGRTCATPTKAPLTLIVFLTAIPASCCFLDDLREWWLCVLTKTRQPLLFTFTGKQIAVTRERTLKT